MKIAFSFRFLAVISVYFIQNENLQREVFGIGQ